jgi:hypothetical protein
MKMSNNGDIRVIRRHRCRVMQVAFGAALTALMALGTGPVGAALARDRSHPSATSGTAASPSPGPLPDRFKAPIGHRQPTAQDVPAENRVGDDAKTKEDKALEDALKSIGRGC